MCECPAPSCSPHSSQRSAPAAGVARSRASRTADGRSGAARTRSHAAAAGLVPALPIRPPRSLGARVICSSGASRGANSTPVVSGAASATACSTTAVVEPQPWPSRTCTTPASSTPRNSAPDPEPAERAPDPGAGVERVQVVHQQQALHERVGDEQRLQALVVADGPHDRLQPGAVEPDQAGDEFLGDAGRLRARAGPEFGEQRLDALPGLPGVAGVPGRWRRPSQIASVMPVGECVVLIYPSVAQVHVHAAGQARVEAAHRPHDVDALEALGRVLLEDRGVLHRVLVGARRPVAVADAAVPRGRRVRVVVRDLPVPDHHVVRQDAAHRLGEAAATESSGTLNDSQVLVRPARTSASACSTKYSAAAAE